METLLQTLSPKRALGLAVSVAVLFGMLTGSVWWVQRRYQAMIIENHTEDVCIQASRRLQVFVASHLRVAAIFAERWATHETADFSKKRFEEFAAVVLSKLPGYAAIGLTDPETDTLWSVPMRRDIEIILKSDAWQETLRALSTHPSGALSAPFRAASQQTGFVAALQLIRRDVPLGHLIVLFQSETLVKDCFHSRIRSEFFFQVSDGDALLFRSTPDGASPDYNVDPLRVTVPFEIENRTWQLTMIPKARGQSGLVERLAVPLLGLVVSLGMGLLTFLLIRRVDMYKVARDKALREIAERQKAEAERKTALERLALFSRKAMAAQEEERARLSIEMHDELGQILTALKLNLELDQKQLEGLHDVPAATLSRAIEMAEKATDELRRICKGLRPPLLDDLGLGPAIRLLIGEFEAQSGIAVDLDLPSEDVKVSVPENVALSAYRVLQESLTNVRRHARATKVAITLALSSDTLLLSVADNGKGFDLLGLGAQQGCGLEGMRERANLVNGRLEIHSDGATGTRVELRAPF